MTHERKCERVRLRRVGRPPGTRSIDEQELRHRLHARWKESAARYRRIRREIFRANPTIPWSKLKCDPRITAAWEKVLQDRDYFNSWCLKKNYPRTPPGSTSRFRMTLHLPGQTYQVNTELSRKCSRLLKVYEQFLWNRPAVVTDQVRVLQVGFLWEFGDLFEPPVDQRHKALARRFRFPTTTIQSYIRRYRRLTVDIPV